MLATLVFATALSANIYDLRWTEAEWNVDQGYSFHQHAPVWLQDMREQFPESQIDYSYAEQLAERAYESAKARDTRGLCLAGVADVLMEVLPRIANFYKLPIDQALNQEDEVDLNPLKMGVTYNGGRSAADFWQWTQENPRQLCEIFGFMRVSNLADGFVAIYAPGECGFHSKFGHIEIIVGDKGCSDHCRPLRQDCRPSAILAPIESCAHMAFNEEV